MIEEDGDARRVCDGRRKGGHQAPRRRELGAYGAGAVVVAVGVVVSGVDEDEEGRMHGGGGKDHRECRRCQTYGKPRAGWGGGAASNTPSGCRGSLHDGYKLVFAPKRWGQNLKIGGWTGGRNIYSNRINMTIPNRIIPSNRFATIFPAGFAPSKS